MWPFGLKANGDDEWTAVVFSSHRVEVARMRFQSARRPQLMSWDSYPREGADLDIVKRLRDAGRLGTGRCSLILPAGQYQLLQIEAPAVPAEEMRDAVRWRIKDMVGFPVEDAGIDCLPAAAPGGRASQIYVVAASRGVLQSWVHLFQDAKAPLQAIDIGELAQRNVSALFEEDGRGLAILGFDEGGGRLTFTRAGELYFTRYIEVAPEEIADAATGKAANLKERILLDVQRTLDNVDRIHSDIPIARLLVSPPPGAADFVDYLTENLYQPVAMLDLGQRIDLSAVPRLSNPAVQSAALGAIGGALRGQPVPEAP